jgi:3'-phosphoadenosine 5'-phosphosulfate sulfotransferase (PAPS reductase)/FAD synthetase
MKRIVGFSGGADSQATALWVRERFPLEDVILLNTDAGGNEHPMTVDFIRDYSERVHPVTVVPAIVADMRGKTPGKIKELGLKPEDPLTFDLLATLKGRFPSTKVRFCTDHLKLQPQLRWMNEHRDTLLKDGFERYIGVRRDESNARSDVDEREYDDFFFCWLNRPLATWTKFQVFDYLASRGEEVNPLYRLGFSRVGCAPCINSGKEDIRLWANRFPEMIDKIREWEQRVGRTFFPPCMPGNRYGWIDEVVEWAKTTHGGKQYSLPILEADIQSGMCMSKWGLCE